MAAVKSRSKLQVWGDVIIAIFLREIKSKFNDKVGISWAVISPVSFIFALSMMRNTLSGGRDVHGMSTFLFMMIGMTLIQFFLITMNSTANAVTKNKQLFSFRQVQPISAILAIAGLEFLIKLFVVIILGIISYLFSLDIAINDPLEVIVNLVKLWLIAVSLGTILAMAYCFVPELKKVTEIITKPLFFISGTFMSLQDIPEKYWHYLTWNPILHIIELTRYAAVTQYGNSGVSDFYVNVITLTLFSFAISCYHISWKQAISH
ncbi:ABC transporter permease [Vibrio nitrifigilis]|uniref:Transport permease protein n=1 Tax=Vibrio nitrifigilis TaxID=2789781 RepID=A0ABS0GFK7_9VIBR|nr:ABC transporter permease [Vibrio nitrifigilis]MBF9001199.1 ABC transporter permease [Vibrio nitrifigilis]